ncbi:uncharacterized protein K02A2.6-like [Ipomoea triloba]|uniref:uncharacterized protein K02A2.6-like n=1 Tax=Ipomoea triloba TaxID=35885 RepID=UPI00125E5531|nr:uncharacterized protein K02A2.6-like [Ipomoea triloba]
MVKWAMELTQYSLEYRPRAAIKGQALADFIVECTIPEEPGKSDRKHRDWEMYNDGASSKKGCGGGAVLISLEGFKAYQAFRFKFPVSNNEAEYEALVGGLKLAKALQVSSLTIRSDSRLVVGHVNNQFETRENRMRQYKEVVQRLLADFERWELVQIPRADNGEADLLSRVTQGLEDHLGYVSQIITTVDISAPSIEREEVCAIHSTPDEWMNEMILYKKHKTTSNDSTRARRVVNMAPSYQIIDDNLFKLSFGRPLLRCLRKTEADKVLAEMHEGVCTAHQGAQTLARKIILQGYYWPRLRADCLEYVKKCPACQHFAILPGRPASYYTPVTFAIPFAHWGMDLIGPFPKGVGGLKFIIVAVDYFTKWVEAEPLASITEYQCRKFVWKHIFTRFGVPLQIVSDNGKQFDNKNFARFCAYYGVEHVKAAVAYPKLMVK